MSDDNNDDNLYDIREVREDRDMFVETETVIPKMPREIAESINILVQINTLKKVLKLTNHLTEMELV